MPSTAIPHPTKCLFSNFILMSNLENKAVVTILAPLNIMQVEPDMKARPIYWSMLEQASDKAGMMKMKGRWGDLPYQRVGLFLERFERQIRRQIDQPMNIVKDCMYGWKKCFECYPYVTIWVPCSLYARLIHLYQMLRLCPLAGIGQLRLFLLFSYTCNFLLFQQIFLYNRWQQIAFY